MSSAPPSLQMAATRRVDWRRAEFVLTVLAFLGFVTIGIRIRTVYGGLPAHPLFIHVPVVLIPLSIIGALACVARPDWFDRYGILLSLVAIVAMSSIFLAMQAGVALLAALHLTGFRLRLILDHQQAAHVLAVVFTLFTACLILTFSAHRISGGWPTGLRIADGVLGSRAVYLLLRVGLIVLALFSAYMVYKVGDLGARAVWEGRLHAGG
ncbi:MAG: DUF2231 domain-containing protein [Solirubrobacteraceae bacterium]